MSKEVTNQLLDMLKQVQLIQLKCKTDKRFKILYDSEFQYEKGNIIKFYKCEFDYIDDMHPTKCYAKKLLISMGINENEL